MLILSRKPGDAVLIDGGIRIVVLSADGGGVRLGIEAPASVGIVREEIARDIAEENARAGATPEARAWLEALGSDPAGPGEAADTDSAADPQA
jgi:carbon storage regulator